ncbi:MAG: hypothetical protein N2C12_18570, partial [Planctomycetales bacterium]
MSPHKMQEMGCTICHEGQGSATDFKWASHTPNSPREAEEWRRKYGWFDNHHWILPMQPERFLQSSCLKCHHEVTELEPSERFPDPPAPKLVDGYKLVQYYGCYGCHEINGFDGPDRRIGPDLRNEPQYSPAAQQLAYVLSKVPANGSEKNADLPDVQQVRALAERVSYHPDNDFDRHQLLDILKGDAARADAVDELLEDSGLQGEARRLANKIQSSAGDLVARSQLAKMVEDDQHADSPQLEGKSHQLASLLRVPSQLPATALGMSDLFKDVEVPGSMRKVGPSLRYVRWKLGQKTLASWIARPQNIRPSSKMPAFFGLHSHLKDDHGKVDADTVDREQIEILSAAHYLTQRSQPFTYAAEDPQVTEEQPSAERGKTQFEIRGCLACHMH